MSSLVPYPPRLVIPPPYRTTLIRAYHDHPLGGHFGVKRTQKKIAGRFYWKTLYEDVARYVRECVPCQTVKANRMADKAPVGQIEPPTEPFELVSLDFVGPLPRHEDFTYILTMIDHFSGWCIAVPVINPTAEVVVQALLERLICQFGVPRRLLTDRGRQFDSSLMRSFCRMLNIKQLMTNSFNPQSNGKVERVNGTIKSSINAIVANPDTSLPWPQLLQPSIFAYNTSTSEATGMSPYYALFGREAVSQVIRWLATRKVTMIMQYPWTLTPSYCIREFVTPTPSFALSWIVNVKRGSRNRQPPIVLVPMPLETWFTSSTRLERWSGPDIPSNLLRTLAPTE